MEVERIDQLVVAVVGSLGGDHLRRAVVAQVEGQLVEELPFVDDPLPVYAGSLPPSCVPSTPCESP